MRARYTSQVNPRIKTLPQMMQLDKRDMKTMTTAVDVLFVKNEARLFSTEGASGGGEWPALSPNYAAAKARTHPGRKIMQRTGRLRRSLTQRRNPQHVAQSALKPRATITVGTRDRTAAFHIRGARKNPRVPERDTLQHTREQLRSYQDKAADYIVNVKLERVRKVLAAAWRVRRAARRA